MDADERYMRLALNLAKKAQGMTNPNPAVGAVIVKGQRVVGRGYHKRCGMPHAEINALSEAGDRARGATLYVTLEPCDHYGRTPPCTDAVIAGGITRVVAAMKDPNPITRGRGIRKLKKHGIKTEVGLLGQAASELNRPFVKFMKTRMPYVTVKVAQSLDGKIATSTGDSRWITSEDSRMYVQRLRSISDAVMVGVNTIKVDDPTLLPRMRSRKQPLRVIVDSRLSTPLDARIFSSVDKSPVILATTEGVSAGKARPYIAKGATVLFARSKDGAVDLKDLLRKLGTIGVLDVLVEGGGTLVAGLIERRLVDRILFFVAPKIIGGSRSPTSVEGRGVSRIRDAFDAGRVKVRRFSKDILIESEMSKCLPV